MEIKAILKEEARIHSQKAEGEDLQASFPYSLILNSSFHLLLQSSLKGLNAKFVGYKVIMLLIATI